MRPISSEGSMQGVGVDIGVILGGIGVDIAAEVAGHATAAALVPVAGLAFSAWRMWRRERRAKEVLTQKVVVVAADALHKSITEPEECKKTEVVITDDISKAFAALEDALKTGINSQIEVIGGRLRKLQEDKMSATLTEDEIKKRLAEAQAQIDISMDRIIKAVQT